MGCGVSIVAAATDESAEFPGWTVDAGIQKTSTKDDIRRNRSPKKKFLRISSTIVCKEGLEMVKPDAKIPMYTAIHNVMDLREIQEDVRKYGDGKISESELSSSTTLIEASSLGNDMLRIEKNLRQKQKRPSILSSEPPSGEKEERMCSPHAIPMGDEDRCVGFSSFSGQSPWEIFAAKKCNTMMEKLKVLWELRMEMYTLSIPSVRAIVRKYRNSWKALMTAKDPTERFQFVQSPSSKNSFEPSSLQPRTSLDRSPSIPHASPLHDLPREKLKPLNKDLTKFYDSKFLYQLAPNPIVNSQYLFGGKRYDMDSAGKSLSHSMHGTNHFLSYCIKENAPIYVPWLLSVEYLGFKMVVTPLFSLSDASLVYGTNDMGRKIVNSDKKLGAHIERCCRLWNLGNHSVWGVNMAAPGDIEGYKHVDQNSKKLVRYYVMGLARCAPPELPSSTSHLPFRSGSGSVFYRLLRPRFLSDCARNNELKRLSNDTCSVWGLQQHQQYTMRLKTATRFMCNELVGRFTKILLRKAEKFSLAVIPKHLDLDDPCKLKFPDTVDIASLMHFVGLPLRHLCLVLMRDKKNAVMYTQAVRDLSDDEDKEMTATGEVSKHVITGLINSRIIGEMVGRCLKRYVRRHVLRERSQNTDSLASLLQNLGKFPSAITISPAERALRCELGSGGEEEAWLEFVRKQLYLSFGFERFLVSPDAWEEIYSQREAILKIMDAAGACTRERDDIPTSQEKNGKQKQKKEAERKRKKKEKEKKKKKKKKKKIATKSCASNDPDDRTVDAKSNEITENEGIDDGEIMIRLSAVQQACSSPTAKTALQTLCNIDAEQNQQQARKRTAIRSQHKQGAANASSSSEGELISAGRLQRYIRMAICVAQRERKFSAALAKALRSLKFNQSGSSQHCLHDSADKIMQFDEKKIVQREEVYPSNYLEIIPRLWKQSDERVVGSGYLVDYLRMRSWRGYFMRFLRTPIFHWRRAFYMNDRDNGLSFGQESSERIPCRLQDFLRRHFALILTNALRSVGFNKLVSGEHLHSATAVRALFSRAYPVAQDEKGSNDIYDAEFSGGDDRGAGSIQNSRKSVTIRSYLEAELCVRELPVFLWGKLAYHISKLSGILRRFTAEKDGREKKEINLDEWLREKREAKDDAVESYPPSHNTYSQSAGDVKRGPKTDFDTKRDAGMTIWSSMLSYLRKAKEAAVGLEQGGNVCSEGLLLLRMLWPLSEMDRPPWSNDTSSLHVKSLGIFAASLAESYSLENVISASVFEEAVAKDLKFMVEKIWLIVLSKRSVGQQYLNEVPLTFWGLNTGGIRALHLQKNNLASFPDLLPELQALEILDLSDNRLWGLPGLGCRAVNTLRCAGNLIQELPASIGGLRQLRRLDVSNNQLVSLPKEIGLLTELAHADMSNNKIKSIPRQITRCHQLTYLDLSQNCLKSLPVRLGTGLDSIQTLKLSANELTSIPATISLLKSLHVLDMHGNPLSSLPKEIGRLSKLQELSVGTADGKVPLLNLPPGMDEMKTLRSLYIGANLLTSLPVSLCCFEHLESLRVERTAFPSLPREIANLKSIVDLELKNVRLEQLPDEIGSLETLKHLILEWNELTSLPCTISGLKNLEILNVNLNKLTELPRSIGSLSALHTLKANSNNLSSLPEEIGNLKRLRRVECKYNLLRSIPRGLGNATSLQSLLLSSNCLTALPDFITRLEKLSRLDIDQNKLKSLPERIDILSEMQELNLSNNRLDSLPPTIGDLKKLKSVKLALNPLPSISTPRCLQSLKMRGTRVILAATGMPGSPKEIMPIKPSKLRGRGF